MKIRRKKWPLSVGYWTEDLVDEERGMMFPLVVFYQIYDMGKSECRTEWMVRPCAIPEGCLFPLSLTEVAGRTLGTGHLPTISLRKGFTVDMPENPFNNRAQ